MRALGRLTVLLGVLSLSTGVAAQEKGAAPAEAGAEPSEANVLGSEEVSTTATEKTVDSGTEAAMVGDAGADADAIRDQTDNTPREQSGKTYYFVGARYRGIIVPKFLQSAFGADGGANVYVNALGPEVGIRRDGFEYNLSAWWAAYSLDPTPFKASTDPATAWEHVDSDINMIFLTSDFLWTSQFSPEFGLNYGLGGGIGLPYGPLHRNEVYPDSANGDDPNDPSTWTVCQSAGGPGGAYCEEGPKDEPNWFNGGSKPILFPWLAAQVGFRIKPHRNFVTRIDLGFGTSGFFVGAGADYGL
ncbi:MAG: hypothetical protein SFV15_21495 [Polyangiaceae bacterium]|nr:hypothetical protein [Polyangiaceae bacterium]